MTNPTTNPGRPAPPFVIGGSIVICHSRRLALAAVVAALAAAGCGGARQPAAGGSNSPKAQETRKLAESYALAASVGAATAEVTAHPEMEKKSAWAKGMAWVRDHMPGTKVSAPAPPAAPPATTPPSAQPTPPPPPTVVQVVRVELAAPPAPVPPPSGSVLVRERVASEIPQPTETEADEAAVEIAAKRLSEAFAKLDPPLDYHPSPAAVKTDFLKRGSRHVRPPTDAEKAALIQAGYAPDRGVYVEYTLEASAEQVREIRGRERVAAALKGFGLLALAAGIGFVFLRVDAWSQGYLTSWLAFIAAALAGGAVAAYVFA